MKSFVHYNASSVPEAIELLAKFAGRAKLNAGGTDLLGVLKDQILPDYPPAVINVKTVPGLNTIEENEAAIRIGALTTLSDLIKSPLVAKTLPMLKEAAQTVASPQIRNVATIGGNLGQDTRCWYYRYPDEIGGMISCFRKGGQNCPAVVGENRYHAILGAKKCFAICPSDIAVVLTALEAKLTISGVGDTRTLPVEKFYTNMGNVLNPAEMITVIQIPQPSAAARQTFRKFTLRKPIDFALVSAASLINHEQGICTRARIVLGAVTYTPVRALAAEEFLQGKELTEETAAKAAELALAGARPLAKNAYKVEIAKAMVKRVVMGRE